MTIWEVIQPSDSGPRMNGDSKKSERRYRLMGIRHDHSQAPVLGFMTWDEAVRAREAIDQIGIFASVHVSLDSRGDALEEE